jgi:transposase
MDVHKKSISACIIYPDENGEEKHEIKVFSTFTDELERLKDWLIEHECPVVAMESTGIYWRPVHNVLEGTFQVVLTNARNMKNVPGRKTDIGDSRWIAGLLRHGLLKSSFIPLQEVRQWRDLTRFRKSYVQSDADYRKRTQKLFESANIKIDSVVSDLFGVTGRNLMQLLITDRKDLTDRVTTDSLTIENPFCSGSVVQRQLERLRKQTVKQNSKFFSRNSIGYP